MSIQVQCGCGRVSICKDEHAGKRAKCPSCGNILQIPSASAEQRGIVLDSHDGLPSGDRQTVDRDDSGFEAPNAIQGRTGEPLASEPLSEIKELLAAMLEVLQSNPAATTNASATSASPTVKKQYKVLTQKDKWFTGKFDPEKLEQALNAYSDQGWSMRGVTTASIPGLMGGNRDEMIVILER